MENNIKLPYDNIDDNVDYLIDESIIEYAREYGEHGYDNSDVKKGVLIANWNEFSQDFIDELEANGYNLEWFDEWTVIDGKAYRTYSDDPMWIEEFMNVDGELVPIAEDVEYALEVKAKEKGVLPHWVNPEKYGYKKVGEIEYGYSYDNNHEEDFKEFENKYKEFVLIKECATPFDVKYSVWAKEK